MPLTCDRCTKGLPLDQPTRLEIGYTALNTVAVRRTHLECERYFWRGQRLITMTWPAMAFRPTLAQSLADALKQVAEEVEIVTE